MGTKRHLCNEKLSHEGKKPGKFILDTEENRCTILKQSVPLTTPSGFPKSVPKYSLSREGAGSEIG